MNRWRKTFAWRPVFCGDTVAPPCVASRCEHGRLDVRALHGQLLQSRPAMIQDRYREAIVVARRSRCFTLCCRHWRRRAKPTLQLH